MRRHILIPNRANDGYTWCFSGLLDVSSWLSFFFLACGILVPQPGIEQWKSGVLPTGPPGNSIKLVFKDPCKCPPKKQISVQFSSVAQLCPTLCEPMNRSMPGLPVHHQLPEFTQTHVHGVSDAIQPSHPLSSPSPPAPNPSQHQSLFKWVNSSHEVDKVLEFQL